MARPADSETDSLGISMDSEAEGDASPILSSKKGEAILDPSQDKDLIEYSKTLGANLQDPDMSWVVREAFDAPLPSSWSEHIDATERIYFFNQVTEESTWIHPMDDVYRELIGLIYAARSEKPESSIDRRAELVRNHLLEVHQRALAQLEGWTGPYMSETGQYYHNEGLNVSTWISPIEVWECELLIRHSVLQRCLLPSFSAGDPKDILKPSSDVDVPRLVLPVGLARREDDGQSSARSFYTARESSRSACSARSLGGESPIVRPKRRTPTPLVDKTIDEERSGNSPKTEEGGQIAEKVIGVCQDTTTSADSTAASQAEMDELDSAHPKSPTKASKGVGSPKDLGAQSPSKSAKQAQELPNSPSKDRPKSPIMGRGKGFEEDEEDLEVTFGLSSRAKMPDLKKCGSTS
eukprot:TRINITY_DN8787_c0_g2_i1.p1 TRINITY_DN8787_c0_g2~~TRINITY_DN8787_c0_g2_i1.p1  ORF type:complete len:408 (-),score=71.27 TRINITY_DN8787_c0_g2_i1:233-1456(-)